MKRNCDACHGAKSDVSKVRNSQGHAYICNWKERRRFCDIIEVSYFRNVVDLAKRSQSNPKFTEEDVRREHSTLEFNRLVLFQMLKLDVFFMHNPNPNDFFTVLHSIHDSLFSNTWLEPVSGRFRRPEDGDVFFGSGRTEIRGAPSEKIENAMTWVFDNTILPFFSASAEDKDTLAQLGANFFVSFFRVHPFFDGNGRTARMFLYSLYRQFGWEFIPSQRQKERREYLKILTLSHRKWAGSRESKNGIWSKESQNLPIKSFIMKYLTKIEEVNEDVVGTD